MKCELCHKAPASEALFRNGNEDDEIYVCAACAKAERLKGQRKSQSTRKIKASDGPFPLIGAIVEAMSDIVGDMELSVREVKLHREKAAEMQIMPAERAAAPFRMKDGFHLEGLHIIGELDAVKRALHALDMDLVGISADGINEAGHVYTLKYSGSSARAKRVVEDLLREERNARIRLREDFSRIFADSICRALAILKNCRLLASGELFDLLSPLRLAAKEKLLDGVSLKAIERMMEEQDLTNSEDALPQDERDRVDGERADRMNKFFEEVMLDDIL